MLRDVEISAPNQIWSADITYIPMRKGFLYLVAIIDWYSRKALSWRLSATMDVDFCIDALEEALTRYGTPEIIQYGSGEPIYQHGLYQYLAIKRYSYFHGWSWQVAG